MRMKRTIIYVVLTFIKLFTIRIDTMREEDPTIYFKVYPNISNYIKSFEDKDLYKYLEYKEKYIWFNDGRYWEICHGNGSMIIEYIYSILIVSWWIISIYLLGRLIYTVMMRS